MAAKNGDNEILESIAAFLDNADGMRNSLSGIYIDETLSEFYRLDREITVPHLPVREIDLIHSREIAGQLIPVLPEFLSGHSFLEKRKPASEQHSLHFIRRIEGKVVDFVHVLRFDFRFSGRRGNITGKGDTERYPEYTTDLIYFKSHLVPVYRGSDPREINSVRLKESIEVETDRRLFTSVIFDEYSTREISIELSRKTGTEIFAIPLKIFPFINYEYFTASLNIPDPGKARLDASVDIFEPLFLYLYFSYREPDDKIQIKEAVEVHSSLERTEKGISLRPDFILNLGDYFSSYTLVTDDDLLLKGWRKFRIN